MEYIWLTSTILIYALIIHNSFNYNYFYAHNNNHNKNEDTQSKRGYFIY
jgi:hypothetical protein